MARIKYYYDTETCNYEKVKVSNWDIAYNIIGFTFLSTIFGGLFAFAYVSFFPSENEARLIEEKQELLDKYEILNNEIITTKDVITELENRDNDIYRVILGAEPLAENVRRGSSGGSKEYYQQLQSENLKSEDLILSTYEKLERLKKRVYIQTKSYDKIIDLAKEKEKMYRCIPSIQPLSNKHLRRLASGFGMRVHPIYKTRRMHTGIDFSAPKGTPLYATGDGIVKKAGWGSGYGKQVEIDHGYGYVTKYAHMSAFNCKVGDKVKRGELIGKVGNTGASVAPHVHYEIIKNGKKINPIHYFFRDLSSEDYDKILKKAREENQSLGL